MDTIDLKNKYKESCDLKLTDGVYDYYVLPNNTTADPESRTIRFSITQEAERLIAISISCTGDTNQLQSFLSKKHHGSVWSCSEKKLQKLTAELIINREIVIVTRSSSEQGHGTFAGEDEIAPEYPGIPFNLGGNSKITIGLIDSETGLPIKNVKLKLHNDGKFKEMLTGNDGKVTLERIKKNSVTDVRCNVMNEFGAHIDNTYSYVRDGYRPVSADAMTKKLWMSDQKKKNSRRSHSYIAFIREVQPKKGDTLDSIATQNGITFKELCLFNWRENNKKKIAELMARDLGCKGISGDPANHPFDGTENLVFVPKPLNENYLSADKTHTFQIKKLGYPMLGGPVVLLVVDEEGNPLKEIECKLLMPDGSEALRKTDEDGNLKIYKTYSGRVKIEIVNYDSSEYSEAVT